MNKFGEDLSNDEENLEIEDDDDNDDEEELEVMMKYPKKVPAQRIMGKGPMGNVPQPKQFGFGGANRVTATPAFGGFASNPFGGFGNQNNNFAFNSAMNLAPTLNFGFNAFNNSGISQSKGNTIVSLTPAELESVKAESLIEFSRHKEEFIGLLKHFIEVMGANPAITIDKLKKYRMGHMEIEEKAEEIPAIKQISTGGKAPRKRLAIFGFPHDNFHQAKPEEVRYFFPFYFRYFNIILYLH